MELVLEGNNRLVFNSKEKSLGPKSFLNVHNEHIRRSTVETGRGENKEVELNTRHAKLEINKYFIWLIIFLYLLAY